MVYKGGRPQGIIDFDMAGPGSRLWDIAYALYTSVPLADFSPKMDEKGVMPYASQAHGSVRKHRIALMVEEGHLAHYEKESLYFLKTILMTGHN
ncbi:hypothetical protein PAECIP112173_01354 [Paenibacillus sp. JJ-100]|uniref:phosphotransferase n=1 Tax=Paenibacillus sp. JJ-100 TaxID=2974896 RepID=UPI0022FF5380|nr:phosphotransferase [Paenibacillus sp. JJ-100]CAI6050126.1 hypothetical protein PAECIP112173_01354 [Paenibacillus sp. JJ-100]